MTASNGNLIVASVWVESTVSDQYSSFADGTNTYGPIGSTSDNVAGTIYSVHNVYAYNITGGALTFTVTVSSGALTSMGTVFVHEYSGATTASDPLDQHANPARQDNPGTGTDALTSGSVTTTTNGQCIVGFSWGSQDFTSVGGLTAGTGGYTGRQSIVNRVGRSEDQVQTSAGAIPATFTSPYSDPNSHFWTSIATFKAAAGGGATGFRSRGRVF